MNGFISPYKMPKRPIDGSDAALKVPEVLLLDTSERALSFCIRNGLVQDVVVDVEGLISSYPGLCFERENLGSFDVAYEMVADNKAKIIANGSHIEGSQRISLAHAFAHFMLDVSAVCNDGVCKLPDLPLGRDIQMRGDRIEEIVRFGSIFPRDIYEYYANEFAVELFMPESVFRRVASEEGGLVPKIAYRFKVSNIAVRYRAKLLGMGGHGL